MLHINRITLATAALLTLGAATAQAGEAYGGIGYGKNTLDGGLRAFGGYTILPGLRLGSKSADVGVEVTYLDIGKTSLSNTTEVTERGLFATAVGTMQVMDHVDVLARVGMGQAEGKLTMTSIFGTTTLTKTGMVPAFGVGARYRLTNRFGIRADLDRYIGIYEPAISLSVSVYSRF